MNAAREAGGRPPLARDAALDRAAQGHACWMAETGTFSHEGDGGSGAKRRVEAQGYASRLTAENIAWGQGNASALIGDWMASSGHRRNILLAGVDAYGAGVTVMQGRLVWVMVFAGN